LELDRHQIERNDFSAARRGYDPDEVDRHLREIADSVSDLKRQQKPSPASLATEAAEQVRSIVEAAERSAAEIQEKADSEGRRITEEASQRARETRERADADAVDRVSGAEEASTRIVERANTIEAEIDRLLGDLRTAANGLVERLNGASGSLQSELEQVRSEFAGVREGRLETGRAGAATRVSEPEPIEEEPEVAAVDEPAVDEVEEDIADVDEEPIDEPEPEPVLEVVEDEPEPAREEAPASSGGGGRSIRGAEGARLIALNMALNGTPRDETARYLAQNFELDDQDALLDEVYQRVGG
jgi:DivIVA domain-containing protein